MRKYWNDDAVRVTLLCLAIVLVTSLTRAGRWPLFSAVIITGTLGAVVFAMLQVRRAGQL